MHRLYDGEMGCCDTSFGIVYLALLIVETTVLIAFAALQSLNTTTMTQFVFFLWFLYSTMAGLAQHIIVITTKPCKYVEDCQGKTCMGTGIMIAYQIMLVSVVATFSLLGWNSLNE